MTGRLTYNERAWAMDVSSAANTILQSVTGPVGHFGGEHGLSKTGQTSLFPDLLLFSDQASLEVVQGWELKMPDTRIDDPALLSNAIEKADRLETNSFVLWNVQYASLWVRVETGGFENTRTWDDLSHINSRSLVRGATQEWKNLLRKIIVEVNELLANGVIRPATRLSEYGLQVAAIKILDSVPSVAIELKGEALKNGSFDDSVQTWWVWNKAEYSKLEEDPWTALARLVVATWINKLVFTHILQGTHSEARRIGEITTGTPVAAAIKLIDEISSHTDFKNILRSQVGQEFLPQPVWSRIIELNTFLGKSRYESIDGNYMHAVLDAAVSVSKRKAAGQFATPYDLAQLVCQITMPSKSSLVLDPCCGTGTIGRAALDIKRNSGIGAKDANAQIWVSDKFSYPIQIAHMSMVDLDAMGSIIHAFTSDVLDLSIGKEIELVNPETGELVNEPLPEFACVISNLPFVRFEDLDVLNSDARSQSKYVSHIDGTQVNLPGKSDLYAYIPFTIRKLLSVGGRAAFITSNSWLGTEWGSKFRQELLKYYYLRTVVISSAEKWFDNADVVTTIMILEKRDHGQISQPSEITQFLTIESRLADLKSDDDMNDVSARIRGNLPVVAGVFGRNSVSREELDRLDIAGLSWVTNFADWSWINEIEDSLVLANSLFSINRGSRRGWNDLFYPKAGHGIESEFLVPVLKNLSQAKTVYVTTNQEAFSCSLDEAEIESGDYPGAAAWIDRFRNVRNKKNQPLTEILLTSDDDIDSWYKMPANEKADLVTSMNPDLRLFFGCFGKPSFVDQRLTRLTLLDRSLDLELLTALLNTSLSAFYLESLGFGRGLGVLDLSSTRLRKGLMMLNPEVLSPSDAEAIKESFRVVSSREVLPILEELEKADRLQFENIVYTAYGINEHSASIRDGVRNLHRIRKAVNN